MNLLILCAEFIKIGLFAVGGGLATLPFLYQLADKYEWLNRNMILDIQAIAQSLPGAIGVNMAAYTGFFWAGIPGGVVAAMGLVFPSIVIISFIAGILQAFKESILVKAVFSGLRPAAAGLLAAACFGAIKLSLYNAAAPVWYELLRLRECLLFVILFMLIVRFKKHPVIYIAAAGAAGLMFQL
ncbi:MAG: chromate transporter [Treponema sp.]|jgi:chromate transporter|nr:chromate transporter [Treponema sp.]